MTKRFAVFGNPVAHSLSPEIHGDFADQFKLQIDYQKKLVREENFELQVHAFFRAGATGCNVTVPFKEQAWRLSRQLSPQAQRARAVNTLYLDNDKQICGHNTDGIGLVNDLLRNLQLTLAGKRITILGAGGATRGILEPLIECKPASIQLINRTRERALKLAEDFNDIYNIQVDGDPNPSAIATDILINATSASLTGEIPSAQPSLITANTTCYDLAYASEPTSFINWAVENGAKRCHDGLGMLIEQAAASFAIWTGESPDTRPLVKKFSSANAITEH